MKNINEMMFRRRQSVLLNKGDKIILPNQYLATILKNIEIYGYTLSKELIDTLNTQSIDSAVEFYKEITSIIKDSIGFKENLQPMYPNFPKQVMEASDVELYINAIIHYLSLGSVLPEYEKEERFPIFPKNSLKIIDLCTEEEVKSIFINLLSSSVSLSENDKKDIILIMDTYKDINSLLPSLSIAFKETLIFLTKELMKRNISITDISKLYKTSTDVLRLAVAMSDGDISLSKKTMFKSFKRSEKKFLLGLLENTSNLEEDMVRYKTTWLRLGERLNPRSFKQFKRVNSAFYKIRNGIKISTFNSKLEDAFMKKDTQQILKLLMSRPGEFARNLDRLLRLDSSMKIVYSFGSIVEELPTSILLQLKNYFKYRNSEKELRVFTPKCGDGTIYGIENNLPKLNNDVVNEILKICDQALLKSYSKRDYLGEVYIDPELVNINIPTSQRHATKSLRSLPKGSRLKIQNDTKVIRSFCYWKEPKNERTDLDLSAIFLDENFNFIANISYMNLRNKLLNSCHSGDITSAPNGAIEYVDIDVKKCSENNVRYVGIIVNSFTETPFSDLPECYYGFMERDEPQTGEIFEPTTVQNKIDISCKKTQVLTSILDLNSYEMICADIPVKNRSVLNNVDSNKNNLILNMKSVLNTKKPNLFDLFDLHANARGEKVDLLKAKTIYCLNKEPIIQRIETSERKLFDMLVSNKTELEVRLSLKEKELEELTETNSQRETTINAINAIKNILETINKGFESSVDKRKFITPYDTDIILANYL